MRGQEFGDTAAGAAAAALLKLGVDDDNDLWKIRFLSASCCGRGGVETELMAGYREYFLRAACGKRGLLWQVFAVAWVFTWNKKIEEGGVVVE